MTAEQRIVCGSPVSDCGERIALQIGDRAVVAKFDLSDLSRALVANLPDILADLLEVAAYVYTADAAIRRGGKVASGMGRDWRRCLHFIVPVRCRAIWEKPDIASALEETLGFLSDDHYYFEFSDHDGRSISQRILLHYGPADQTAAEEIILFSGGLDSFAGAAEAILERRKRVALVSHHSAPFTKGVQATLVKALRARSKPELIRHFRLDVKMQGGDAAEGTHRTRSFLFAALGLVVARSFGRNRVDFYENGIVSLNLAPLEQFVGGRATRSTHPLVLTQLSRLFGALLDQPVVIENPFLWRTKADIVGRIRDLGLGDALAKTHSCANVRVADRMHTHCGRCSQCIDRRFAILAQSCERYDPTEGYRVDLLAGHRLGDDRELALAYVRNARGWRAMSPTALLARHPEVTRVLAGLQIPAGQGAGAVSLLCSRHGQSVTAVMEKATQDLPADTPADCLAALYVAGDRAAGLPGIPMTEVATDARPFLVEFDEPHLAARLEGSVVIRGANYATLAPLVVEHFKCLGGGLAPEDFSTLSSQKLMSLLKLSDEGSVRRRIAKLRGVFADAGDIDEDVVENVPWHGYRLKPEAVVVRRASLDDALSPPPRTPG